MFRAVIRPRALWQPIVSTTGRRLASTAPVNTRYTWKGTAARWGLAIGALYWYNTSPIFADELPSRLSTEPAHFSEQDLTTVDAIVEEKRKTLDARLRAKEEQAAKDRTAQQPLPAQRGGSTPAVATGEDAERSPEQLEEEAGQQGAFNPETGEINWDCPCLGGMAHGPCGEQFKAAFSCFVYSTEEVKGMDCVDKFQHMQDCFRKYPEVYGEEIADEEAAEREAEAVASGDAQKASPKDAESPTSALAKPERVDTPTEAEVTSSKSTSGVEQKAHDATAVNSKAVTPDATKPTAATSPVAAPAEGKSHGNGQGAIPQKSYDATSANSKASE